MPEAILLKSPENSLNTLASVSPGQTVRVTELQETNPELYRKLHAMGIVSGSSVTVIGRAPFGDPISVSTLGYVLSLRRTEASHIGVTSLS